MEEILTTGFAARKVYDSGTETFSLAEERFFLIGNGEEPVWIATMEGEPLPTRTYNHMAFKIPDSEYEDYLLRVRALGLEVREGRSRVPGEGRSIYFYDHDNHSTPHVLRGPCGDHFFAPFVFACSSWLLEARRRELSDSDYGL